MTYKLEAVSDAPIGFTVSVKYTKISNPTFDYYHALYQNKSLQIGKRYKLSYWAKSNTSGTVISARNSIGALNDTSISGTLTTTWQYFEGYFIATILGNIRIFLLNSAGLLIPNLEIFITGVSVIQVGCVAEYLPENAGRIGWIETMNGLHGSTSGSPICLNTEQRPLVYRDVKLAIANTATALT